MIAFGIALGLVALLMAAILEFNKNTVLGFVLLALAAIREAESADDRAAVLSSLYAINGLSGATGTITMSPSGDPIKSILIESITGSVEAPIASVLPGSGK